MSVTPLHEAWQYTGGDPGIVLFSEALKAWKFDLPEGARVLELGCCESDWAKRLIAARSDVKVTGIDVRECPDYPGTFVQGDAAKMLTDTGCVERVRGWAKTEAERDFQIVRPLQPHSPFLVRGAVVDEGGVMNRRAFLSAVAAVPVAGRGPAKYRHAANPTQSFLQLASAVDAGTVIDNAYLNAVCAEVMAAIRLDEDA